MSKPAPPKKEKPQPILTLEMIEAMEKYLHEPPADELQTRLQRVLFKRYIVKGVRDAAVDYFLRTAFFMRKRQLMGHKVDLSILDNYGLGAFLGHVLRDLFLVVSKSGVTYIQNFSIRSI